MPSIPLCVRYFSCACRQQQSGTGRANALNHLGIAALRRVHQCRVDRRARLQQQRDRTMLAGDCSEVERIA